MLILTIAGNTHAQYAPGAGIEGSDAVHFDSSAIRGWAINSRIARGYMQINDKSLGLASAGDESACLGKADNNSVSLGDSGYAILSFAGPIENIKGPDFAVFENSFDGHFLELAFVDVSTDSVRWVRFPSSSLTQVAEQTSTFGTTDPVKINNLAGKHLVLYGTPFDLDELKDSAGIDINRINFVRITDVIGKISDPFGSLDSKNNRINDPWPTPFPQSGFDLDAVAVLRSATDRVDKLADYEITIFPNPVYDVALIRFRSPDTRQISVFDNSGKLVFQKSDEGMTSQVDMSGLEKGLYIVRIKEAFSVSVHKIIKI